MDTPKSPTRFLASRPWPMLVAWMVLVVILLLALLVPLGWVIGTIAFGPPDSSGLPSSASNGAERAWAVAMLRTVAYASAIGALAALLGWPAAWLMRARALGSFPAHRRALRHDVSTGLLLVPLLLPCYLAYAGWGLLRGPGTPLGDWLGGQEPWINLLAGRVAAVWGLALWVWPIATIAMLPRLRRIDHDSVEAFRMFAPSRWSFGRAMLAAQAPALLRASAVVALLMLGSAIPLHVAQIETYANELWKRLQFTGSVGQMWRTAWPVLLVAGLAAAMIARSLRSMLTPAGLDRQRPLDRPGAVEPPRPSRTIVALAIIVWTLSVPVPAALFAYSLRQRRSLTEFWTLNAQPLADSGLVAATTAALALALCGAVWFVAAGISGRARLAGWALACTLGLAVFGAITPGVLIGSALAESWGRWLDRAPDAWAFLSVSLAHVARFAIVPVIVGLALAWIETRDLRDARRQFGGGPWSVRAFWALHVRPHWPVLIGAALAVGCLSLHEIESAVMAQPPGLDSLARTLLDYLHFARDEQLSAAALNLLAVGSLAACVAGALLGRLLRNR